MLQADLRTCGFTGLGPVYSTKVRLFFIYCFLKHFESLFLLPNGLSAPIWLHFEVILRSILCHFLNGSLFQKHAFRLDETVVFEVLEGWISVLFRNIS